MTRSTEGTSLPIVVDCLAIRIEVQQSEISVLVHLGELSYTVASCHLPRIGTVQLELDQFCGSW